MDKAKRTNAYQHHQRLSTTRLIAPASAIAMKEFTIILTLCSCWVSSFAYQISSCRRSSTFSRRQLLQRTAAASIILPVTQLPPSASAKGFDDEISFIKSTSDTYHLLLKNKQAFISELSAEESTSALPPQVPAITFQKLSKVAHGVEGKIESDDFSYLAVEYAELAGAARDYFKLAKLGRLGENGSPEVAMEYAQQCVSKLEEASVVLETLLEAVE